MSKPSLQSCNVTWDALPSPCCKKFFDVTLISVEIFKRQTKLEFIHVLSRHSRKKNGFPRLQISNLAGGSFLFGRIIPIFSSFLIIYTSFEGSKVEMGLFSNRVAREDLKAGDHIYTWRAAYIYAHHGIYVGDNKVINFTRGQGKELGTGTVLDVILTSSVPKQSDAPCPNCSPHEGDGVLSSCLDCFLDGGILYLFEYSVSPILFLAKARGGTCTLASSDPDELVVHRALYLLNNGFGCYNVFKNNCEDFAIYCKTGLLVIAEGPIGRSGQAASIIGGNVAAVLASPMRFVTNSVYGMAASAVVVYCASRYAADIGQRRDAIKVDVEDLGKTNQVPPLGCFRWFGREEEREKRRRETVEEVENGEEKSKKRKGVFQ